MIGTPRLLLRIIAPALDDEGPPAQGGLMASSMQSIRETALRCDDCDFSITVILPPELLSYEPRISHEDRDHQIELEHEKVWQEKDAFRKAFG